MFVFRVGSTRIHIILPDPDPNHILVAKGNNLGNLIMKNCYNVSYQKPLKNVTLNFSH